MSPIPKHTPEQRQERALRRPQGNVTVHWNGPQGVHFSVCHGAQGYTVPHEALPTVLMMASNGLRFEVITLYLRLRHYIQEHGRIPAYDEVTVPTNGSDPDDRYYTWYRAEIEDDLDELIEAGMSMGVTYA